MAMLMMLPCLLQPAKASRECSKSAKILLALTLCSLVLIQHLPRAKQSVCSSPETSQQIRFPMWNSMETIYPGSTQQNTWETIYPASWTFLQSPLRQRLTCCAREQSCMTRFTKYSNSLGTMTLILSLNCSAFTLLLSMGLHFGSLALKNISSSIDHETQQ